MSTPNLVPHSPYETALLSWIDGLAPYGVITTDLNLHVQTWNRWMETSSHLSAESVKDKHLFDLFPDLKERRLDAPLRRALQGEVAVLSTALHRYLLCLPPRTSDTGFSRMQQTASVAALVHAGSVIGTIIVIEDVTDREAQAAILRRQTKRDKLLSWALGHLLKSRDLRRTMRELFFKLAEDFDFDAYFLYLFEENDSVTLQAAGGLLAEEEDRFRNLDAKESSWLCAGSFEQPLVSERVLLSQEPETAVPRQLGFRAYLSLPLIMDSQVIGIFGLATRSRDTIGGAELELLAIIAQYLAIALNREIAERQLREAQAQLRSHAHNLEREVAERTAKLRETIAELQIFSYSLAHDLRAPIRALIGYCEVLLEDYGKEIAAEPQEIISALFLACKKLDTLTRDLLEFLKLSREDVRLAPIDTSQVVADVLSLNTMALREAVQIREPLLPVFGNRQLLQRCVANLLDNAFKFVHVGTKPVIRVWSEIVPGSTSQAAELSMPFSSALIGNPPVSPHSASHLNDVPIHRGPKVRVYVEDEGIGVPPNALEKIFGIFERATSNPRYDGTGIGLAIVARAMQRMGGHCGVEVGANSGSRFWLELNPAGQSLAEVHNSSV